MLVIDLFYPILTTPGIDWKKCAKVDLHLFILFFCRRHALLWASRDLLPKMMPETPYISRRTKQWGKLPNFCGTHKHPECRSHSLPDVLCLSCSNKAAATSGQTPGKQSSPPKRAAIWKHIFIDNLGKLGIHLRKSHNSVRNEQFMHIIIKFIFISSYSSMWDNSVWEIMLIS